MTAAAVLEASMVGTHEREPLLVAVGDSHGDWPWVWPEGVAAFLHVGDFGYWPEYPQLLNRWLRRRPQHAPVFFVEGNHDDCDTLRKLKEVTEVWPGLFYCPRGTVLTFGSRRVGFCGGSDSVDRMLRPPTGINRWQPSEALTDNIDFEPGSIDLLVTHTPPHDVVLPIPPAKLAANGWEDRTGSAVALNRIWARAGYPPLVCGHIHRSGVYHYKGTRRVTVLDINEMLEV